MSWWAKWSKRWEQRRCQHDWRPAIGNGNKPMQVCDSCQLCQTITDAQFYALFGRTAGQLANNLTFGEKP